MKGIISDACAANLDESPFAYKNINQVIERQAGIVVEVIDHFKPIINVKG
jgi:tRNA-splicing ligase RtcB